MISENCMGFQWAVSESKIAVEIIAERSIPKVRPGTNRPSKISGVSQALGRQSLYMTGAVAACVDGYGDGLFSRTH